MNSPPVDIQSRFINALRTQASHKPETRVVGPLPCPYGHPGRIFQSFQQLLDHARAEHLAEFEGLNDTQSLSRLQEALSLARQSEQATANIAGLSLDARQTSPPSGKKRRAGSEIGNRREKGPSSADNVFIADTDLTGDLPPAAKSGKQLRAKPYDPRLYNYRSGSKGSTSPPRTRTGHSSDRSVERASTPKHQTSFALRQPSTPAQSTGDSQRQPGLIELQKYDPRYPGLLLQPDSRPISQEQLASEVKSIYAGLTMVETKCIHVDRAQAAAKGDNSQELAPDHWQALIALHRTLLHEHHDFFLASQHPSASPALRRLAAKYTMPARMWKHGIHSFLELLRQRLPKSLDYMLAFIYLAYQMMALLYETVPAFEDTWIECLGDLGRYRMAIEDEDIRDRETWANVARSWYSKAADKNPPVGRLYHHLAILARPNALQQIYYYGRSLNSVEPFPSARESVMTLFKPFVLDEEDVKNGHDVKPFVYTPGLPIDTLFTGLHALYFTRRDKHWQDQVWQDFMGALDNHIGRVTAKWKEQGVYIAVTNVSGWFDYGVNSNPVRQLFRLRAEVRKDPSYVVQPLDPDNSLPLEKQDPQRPRFTEEDLLPMLKSNEKESTFCRAKNLTNETFALVLRRIGDKNVLPHVHIMLSFLATFAAIDPISHLIDQVPWADVVGFLNTLIKTENQQSQGGSINESLTQPVFAAEGDKGTEDNLPLPEDWLIRGLIWAEEYLPTNWFSKEVDEEERYLELASTARRRSIRTLRLGYRLSSFDRWISYKNDLHTFVTVS